MVGAAKVRNIAGHECNYLIIGLFSSPPTRWLSLVEVFHPSTRLRSKEIFGWGPGWYCGHIGGLHHFGLFGEFGGE